MDWRVKALIQKVLSMTSGGDKLNHVGSLLMNPNYMKEKLGYHINEALIHMERLNKAGYCIGENDVSLELGTGYAIVESLTMILLGVKKVITVDITKDVKFSESLRYLEMFSDIHVKNIASKSRYTESQIWEKLKELKLSEDMEDFLGRAGITYIAPYSIADLEPFYGEVTVCYSQVVFEHVPEPVMWEIFSESKKFLSSNGFHSHIVNLTDHFRNPGFFRDSKITDVNFLKYSDEYWKFWCGNSIAYVNRLRFPFYIDMLRKLGFKIIDVDKQKDKGRMNELLSYDEIHEDVKSKYDKNELMDTLWIQRFHFVCRKDGESDSQGDSAR